MIMINELEAEKEVLRDLTEMFKTVHEVNRMRGAEAELLFHTKSEKMA